MPGSQLFKQCGQSSLSWPTLLLLALLAWPVSHTGAQPQMLHFQHLRPEHGLSQLSVFAIHQDQRGFIWLGTQDGLNRWDGEEFVVYSHDPKEPETLPNNFVRALAEDQDGALWVGTLGGVGRLDRLTDRFHGFRHEEGNPQSLSGDDIRDLHVAADGTLWIASWDGGIDRLNPETSEIRHLDLPPSENNLVGATAITGDGRGRIWIGLRDGRATLPPGGEHAVRFQPDVIKGEVLALYQEPAGPLWAGTAQGLVRVDFDRGEVQIYLPDSDDPFSLHGEIIRSLLGTRHGSLWIGTEAGLHRLDPGGEKFHHFRHDANNSSSLSGDRVVSLFEDRAGLLWVGTVFGGVGRADISQPFYYYQPQPDLAGGLPRAQITRFAEISPEEFLIGTFESGLLEWDRQTGNFSPLDTRPENASRPAGVMSMLIDRNEDLWVGTFGAGLAHRPAGQNEFRHYLPIPGDETSLGSSEVVSIFEDSQARLWLGAFRSGLDLFDRDRGIFHRYRVDGEDPTSIGGTIINAIVEDTAGQLWLGFYDAGLDRFDPESGHFEHFKPRAGDSASLPSETVTALHIDRRGTLWIGTSSGLARLEETAAGGRFRVWTEADGLPNNTINGLGNDALGRLWALTNRGIVRLDPETETIQVYGARHGLPKDESMSGAYFTAHGGEILLGYLHGFVTFDPSQIAAGATRDLPIELISMSLGNRAPDLQAPIEDLKELRLGPRDRQLTLEFAALDFAAPGETRYRYRLDGFDEEWVEMGKRRPVTYTNLDPGNYVFSAAACTADGLCKEDAIGLAIAVDAPPWQQWWALLLYALTLIGIVYGGTRWRLGGLRRRSQELEALVAQRTTELSTTVEQLRQSEGEATAAQRRALKSLEEALEERRRAQEANSAKSAFLSNMSHELRTPLNAMLGFAQLMERDPALTGDHRESISTILRSGEHLLGLINDVLSLSKIEAGKLSLSSETFDPRRMLNSAVEMVRGRAEEKNLDLRLEVAESFPQAARGDSGRLLQVLVNLLSNAVKFTESGRVDLRVRYKDDRARFEVEDTGPGIAPAHIERLFDPFVQSADGTSKEGTGLGLTISRRLVEIMGGEIEVWSEVGRGSTFAFEIPLHEAASGRLRQRRRQVAGLALDQKAPRILIVDDAEENRRLLRRLLTTVGISIQEASNGSEAVEAWAKWKPQLIFMDIRMPVMGGDEATRRIRQAEAELGSSRTIVIALTATAFDHDRRRILAAGCDDLVTKPFQEALLFDKLSEHLDIRFLYKEPPRHVAVKTESTPVETPQHGTWRVLLAEDNQANQLVARRMLERLGIDVEVVGNGRAAVDAFTRQDFDLVLMDVRMPEMDGLRATRRLRQRLPRDLQPVIVALTGLASEDERRKCLDAGMDAVLPKPFRLDDLESLVDDWLPPPSKDRPQPRYTTEESVTDLVSREDVEAVRRTAAAVAAGILDYRKLEALRQLDRDTEVPLATQVIDLFLDTVPSQVDELRRAVIDGDRHRWRRIAHSLKNSSGTLGADELADACKELEELGRLPAAENLPDLAAKSLERLVAAATEALAALENERRS